MKHESVKGMWREGEAGARLSGRDAAYAEEASDFGCLVGGGNKVMFRPC